MADNSFKVKNSIVIQGIELDLSGATTDQVLTFNGTKFSAASVTSGAPTVSDTAPESPSSGDVWFNSSLGRLFVYYDSAWIEVSGPIGPTGATGPDRLSVSDSAPSSPALGDLWFNSSNAGLFSYYDSTWIEITGRPGIQGPTGSQGVAGPTGPTGPIGPNPLTSADTAPSSPSSGDLWFDSSEAKLYAYLDSYWIEISGEAGPTGPTGPAQLADVSSTQPSSPVTGQLWYNTSNGQLNVYDGSSWNVV